MVSKIGPLLLSLQSLTDVLPVVPMPFSFARSVSDTEIEFPKVLASVFFLRGTPMHTTIGSRASPSTPPFLAGYFLGGFDLVIAGRV